MALFINIYWVLMALVVGSFLNVVIHRLPMMIQDHHASQDYNLWYPRSHCPQCKKTIVWWQLIPLLGFFLINRRCHECQEPISWQYPLVELTSVILALCIKMHFGLTIEAGGALLLVWYLIALFVIDLKHQVLPDCLTLGLLWIGLLLNTQNIFTTLPDAVISAALAYSVLWLLIHVYALITGKIGMGHGDFKLFAALAAWFGLENLPLILLISSSIGAITGYIYLKKTQQSKNTPIPFGPFLCISGVVVLFTLH